MPFAKRADVQQTCWKCEGSVSSHMHQCPYCSAFLQDPPVSSGGFSSCHLSLPKEETRDSHDDLFAVSSEDWEAVLNDQTTFRQVDPQPHSDRSWVHCWPVVSLFLGMGLLAFALLILLFASDSGLVLSWSKNRAYIYSLAGSLLVYRGYQKLSD